MKRYNKNFKYTQKLIEECIYLCLNSNPNGKSRWKRQDVAYFFARYHIELYEPDADLHETAKYMHNVLISERWKLADMITDISEDMYREIKDRNISLSPIIYQKRFDKTSGKVRDIGISTIKQQVYDYIAVESCKKMFDSKIGQYQCASIKGRGQIYGKEAIEKWIRKNPKKTKYAFKCDVRKYYPSVNHDILKTFLKRDIKNEECLYVLYTLIDSYGEKGLCIGSYLSQYLANYFLSYAYHYITEQVYKIRNKKNGEKVRVNLINHALFYMDDILLLGSRKADVKKAAKLLEKYLNEVLELSLKSTYQLFPVDSRPIDMMGFKIYRSHTEIRRKTFLKLRKCYIKYKDISKEISLKDARTIVGYYGYIKHSDSIKFKKKYKVDRTINKAKGVVSYYDSCIYRKTALL